MSSGFTSHVTCMLLPEPIQIETGVSSVDVWEFKYDDPGDWALILDNLGFCFERGVQPISDLFVGDGEMQMWQLHWTMLGKLTNMTRLIPVKITTCEHCKYEFIWIISMGGECPNCGGVL